MELRFELQKLAHDLYKGLARAGQAMSQGFKIIHYKNI